MSEITLKQLRYFEAVARHKHFGKAASDCAVTQPALSMQIRDLETSLGVVLLERNARDLKLTRFGIEFLARTKELLRSADELKELARASKEDFSGNLRIGIIPTIAPYLLPKTIAALKAIHPDLEIQVRETQTQKLMEELSAGAIDTAIVALPVSVSEFREVALFSEEFLLVRRKEHKARPVPSAEGLREMKLLLLEEGHCFRDQALSFCSINDKRPREILDGSSLSTLVQMVGAGMGVTLIPEMAVSVETSSADVSVARFATPRPRRTIGMIWRKTNPLAKQLSGIADHFKRLAKA